MGRVVAIVQARLGSTRLPGKVMREVAGVPLIGHMLDRLSRCERLDQIVVATPEDDGSLIDYVEQRGIPTYQGSERDVLARYAGAARAHKAEAVVRLTADCPLIDPILVDQVVEFFLEGSFDYASNTLERGFPRGMDVEVFSIEALERAEKEATEAEEREHVTLHLYRHADRFKTGHFELRLTVDTPADFALVEKLLLTGGERLSDWVKLWEEQ